MDENIIALLKIGKKENLRHIYEEGQFYMSPSKLFYTEAQENPESLVYDLHESSFPRTVTIDIGDMKITPFDEEDDQAMSMNLGINTCIFCCYAIMERQIVTHHGKTCFIVPQTLIKSFVDKNAPEKYEIVILKQPGRIVDKVVACAQNFGLPVDARSMLYDDHDFACKLMLLAEDINRYALELCFHKCKRYAPQNEFRIAIVNGLDVPREDIKIGRLSADEYARFDVSSTEQDICICF